MYNLNCGAFGIILFEGKNGKMLIAKLVLYTEQFYVGLNVE